MVFENTENTKNKNTPPSPNKFFVFKNIKLFLKTEANRPKSFASFHQKTKRACPNKNITFVPFFGGLVGWLVGWFLYITNLSLLIVSFFFQFYFHNLCHQNLLRGHVHNNTHTVTLGMVKKKPFFTSLEQVGSAGAHHCLC